MLGRLRLMVSRPTSCKVGMPLGTTLLCARESGRNEQSSHLSTAIAPSGRGDSLVERGRGTLLAGELAGALAGRHGCSWTRWGFVVFETTTSSAYVVRGSQNAGGRTARDLAKTAKTSLGLDASIKTRLSAWRCDEKWGRKPDAQVKVENFGWTHCGKLLAKKSPHCSVKS